MLVFCGRFVTAIEHLLENVSVDFDIINEQCFELIELPICARHAHQETANRHIIFSIGVGRNRN